MESTQQARIRRLQDTLIIAGDGVIAFVAWGMAKSALFLALTKDDALREMFSLGDEIPIYAIFIVVGVMLLIDMAVRLYVGLSARAEGRGKKKSPLYLVVAALAGAANAYSGIAIVFGMALTLSSLDAVVSFIIEVTSLVALALVIYCSVRLRRMNEATE